MGCLNSKHCEVEPCTEDIDANLMCNAKQLDKDLSENQENSTIDQSECDGTKPSLSFEASTDKEVTKVQVNSLQLDKAIVCDTETETDNCKTAKSRPKAAKGSRTVDSGYLIDNSLRVAKRVRPTAAKGPRTLVGDHYATSGMEIYATTSKTNGNMEHRLEQEAPYTCITTSNARKIRSRPNAAKGERTIISDSDATPEIEITKSMYKANNELEKLLQPEVKSTSDINFRPKAAKGKRTLSYSHSEENQEYISRFSKYNGNIIQPQNPSMKEQQKNSLLAWMERQYIKDMFGDDVG